jgi:hypothetical protein
LHFSFPEKIKKINFYPDALIEKKVDFAMQIRFK